MRYDIIYYNSKIPLGCFELKQYDLGNHQTDRYFDLEKFNYRMRPKNITKHPYIGRLIIGLYADSRYWKIYI